ncbi:uncharacterized protein [Paramisgurnus dabryanus]|uniref:uncharacterized protein n=1 Tax=Paramisgurnus dabryanus TaxID=90735 RepID=UPI0031F36CCE
MYLLKFLLLSVPLMIADGFTVKGSSGPLVVPLGGSVVLPCSVDSLLPLKGLEVEWRRSDSQTLIHLYQDEDIRPEVQHQDYHDRAHFFTEDIKHGNFSLLLNNLTAEDEGQYTCKVYSGQESGETGVEIKHVERLIVSGSSRSISASVGGDVTLNCSVNSHIKPEEIEEVSWKKRDKDEEILVLLYQNNKTQSEASDERYRDRVEFFTDEIHRGNFSLRLKGVRTEDKGVYICQVFAGELSANTTVILQQLGFSVLHILVLILCIAACGSALLFCSLIYCRSNNTGFIVKGSYKYNLGDSGVLPCFIDPHLIKKGLKVEWRRSDLKNPLCVYQDEDIRPESQHQDYHDRAHFFTEDIKLGNFSLLLKNLREEDKGQYTCKVHRKWMSVFSVNVNLETQSTWFIVNFTYDQVVPPGGSVILPCFNNQPLPEEEGLKVEWRRSDSQTLIHLYQDEDIRPDAQHQDYHDRAHFFTEDIKHGNFSLLLNNLTAEDEGEYTCTVYNEKRTSRSRSGSRSDSGSDSGTDEFTVSTTLVPRLLDSVYRLQMCLIFCSNLIMFLAFILWGLSEGSVNETICCCALYLLRPHTLLWAAPYINNFKEKNKGLILEYSYVAEYFVLTAVVYSALFTNTWEKLMNYDVFDRVLILVLYALMFMCCFSKSIYILVTQIGNKKGKVLDIFDIIADLTFEILPTLQFILLFYTFAAKGGFIIIVAILPMILTASNERMFVKCYVHFRWSDELIATVQLIVTLVMNALMIGFFIFTLDNQTDPIGWACVMVFLQILWAVVRFSDQSFYYFDLGFHRYISVYVFGSVGVVLISAVALITELILKTGNGERALMDLRFIVFPSECFFILSVMILGQVGSKIKTCLQSCQTMRCRQNSARKSQQNQESPQNPVTVELLDQN